MRQHMIHCARKIGEAAKYWPAFLVTEDTDSSSLGDHVISASPPFLPIFLGCMLPSVTESHAGAEWNWFQEHMGWRTSLSHLLAQAALTATAEEGLDGESTNLLGC